MSARDRIAAFVRGRAVHHEGQMAQPVDPWQPIYGPISAKRLPADLIPLPGDGAPLDPGAPWRYYVLGVNIRLFMLVNGRRGWEFGDRVLALLERAVSDLFTTETVFRWAPDEYIVILARKQYTDEFVAKIRQSLWRTMEPLLAELLPYDIFVEVSSTIVSLDLPRDGQLAGRLVDRARRTLPYLH